MAKPPLPDNPWTLRIRLACAVWLLLLAAGLLMQGRLSALVASYGTQFALSGPGLRGSLLLLAGSALMGWLGAWLATGHHLRRTRPVDV